MSWIETYTGKQFDPLKPDLEAISIKDIAHSLSLLCRFNGHCSRFYSVAQHSVLACKLDVVPQELRLTVLMHDAGEAYVGDVTRPVKRELPKLKEMEAITMEAISAKFGLVWPFPDEVKMADNIMLVTERRDLLTDSSLEWNVDAEATSARVEPWDPNTSESAFLATFKELAA